MKTFAIGTSLSFDVTRHLRIDGSRLPVPDSSYVVHVFRVVARWNGTPILVEWFGWMGKKVLPVNAPFNPTTNLQITEVEARTRLQSGLPVEYRQIGTKPGGDFRSRFFKGVARRIGKVIRGQQLGKTYGQVTEADITSAAVSLRNLLRGAFTDPDDLLALSLDDAWRFLRDASGEPEEGTAMPGTTLAIDCDFDSHARNDGTQDETGTGLHVGSSSGFTYRVQIRFPLSGIAAGSTVTDSDIQFAVLTESGTGQTVDINSYDTAGTANPDTDAAATKYTNSAAGTELVNELSVSSTGSKTADLGATADGEIQANISSPATWSLGIEAGAGMGVDEDIFIQSIENAGSDPPTLTVVYTEPAGGGARLIGSALVNNSKLIVGRLVA